MARTGRESIANRSGGPTVWCTMGAMHEGLTATLVFTVGESDTAVALLSGDLPVLGTPRLVAWLEAATCAAVGDVLAADRATVGTRVAVSHRAASPLGATVQVTATLTRVEGGVLEYAVAAVDAATGSLLGDGVITRAVVDRDRFLARLSS